MTDKNFDIVNSLSTEEYNKYARHIILDRFGVIGQKRLKRAKVLLIGAGGLACPCVIYLASSGIGHIGIIDDDFIKLSNLQRQILYNITDINQLKTEIAKKKIHEINPKCRVNIYSYKLTDKNAFSIIKNYHIIIDASDNFITRYIIDKTCQQLHKVHIYGAIQQFEGHMSVFNYKSGPKYSDLYPQDLGLKNNNCSELGVLGVLPGIIGILQATEAIKIIVGLGKVLSGYLLIYNADSMSFKKTKILSFNKLITKCKYKENYNNVIYCSHLDKIKDKQITFIDVRQKIEFKKKHINKAINIPLKTIEYKSNLDLFKGNLKNQTIILYCNHNSRAIIASNILRKHQVEHFRLENGLYEWIKNKLNTTSLYSVSSK